MLTGHSVESLTLVLQVEAVNPAQANCLTDSLEQRLEDSLDNIVVYRQVVYPSSLCDAGFILITVFPPELRVELAQTLAVWLARNTAANLIIGFGGAVPATSSARKVLKVVERALTRRPHKVSDV